MAAETETGDVEEPAVKEEEEEEEMADARSEKGLVPEKWLGSGGRS